MFKLRKSSLLVLLIGLMLLSACGDDEVEKELSEEGSYVADQSWMIEDFTYTNESEESISLADLEDEVWIADFIFTNCTSVCPPMSANMSKIQQQLEDKGLEVPLVSFSVDPDIDTPEVLKDYAEDYTDNLDTWHFLTGYSFEENKELSEGTFKSPLAAPAEGDDQFTHGVFFYLVEGNQIIKTYNGVTNVPIDAIVEDVQTLKGT